MFEHPKHKLFHALLLGMIAFCYLDHTIKNSFVIIFSDLRQFPRSVHCFRFVETTRKICLCRVPLVATTNCCYSIWGLCFAMYTSRVLLVLFVLNITGLFSFTFYFSFAVNWEKRRCYIWAYYHSLLSLIAFFSKWQ